MQENPLKQQFLKNEKIQIFLRIVLVSIFLTNLFYFHIIHEDSSRVYPFLYVIAPPIIVIVLNILYFFLINRYPYLYQEPRITIVMIFDIVMTVWVFYYVGNISIYYSGVLLWFIVGYGSRYGIRVGYIAYFTVLISWLFLLRYSAFWQENLNTGIGWLVAYAILPLYYFHLIAELQNRIHSLHKDVNESSYRAGHDVLTELPNRLLFEKKLNKYINDYEQTKQKFALFFVDLDKFKEINDVHGHTVGDHVLIEASKRIKDINEFTSRLGGDEFVCIVEYESIQELEDRACRLLENINQKCENSNVTLSASIGISCYPQDTISVHDIKKYSDKAMYKAKHLGKNRYCLYSKLEDY